MRVLYLTRSRIVQVQGACVAPVRAEARTGACSVVRRGARHLPRQLRILPAWTKRAYRAGKWSQSMRSSNEALWCRYGRGRLTAIRANLPGDPAASYSVEARAAGADALERQTNDCFRRTD